MFYKNIAVNGMVYSLENIIDEGFYRNRNKFSQQLFSTTITIHLIRNITPFGVTVPPPLLFYSFIFQKIARSRYLLRKFKSNEKLTNPTVVMVTQAHQNPFHEPSKNETGNC